MKKIVAGLFITWAVAFAADPHAVVASSDALRGALEHGGKYRFSVVHIPEYGLQAVGQTASSFGPAEVDLEEALMNLPQIVVGLAGTVRGLDEGDWVSATLHLKGMRVGGSMYEQGDRVDHYITVRVRAGEPESLELWVDGERHE